MTLEAFEFYLSENPNGNYKIEAEKEINALKIFNYPMVFIPGGTFQMGSNYGNDDERPRHIVTVDSFYLGKFEVTLKWWKTIVPDNPEYFFWNTYHENCPVDYVTWDEVQEFIDELNLKTGKHFRLPTEAEWEYAARGGPLIKLDSTNTILMTKFAGSDNIDKVAWYSKNSDDKTHPIGQKEPNQLGLFDMSGNVWEWCSDWYDKDYYKSIPKNNPTGPATGKDRVIRGGSYEYKQEYCYVVSRHYGWLGYRDQGQGFRLAHD